MALLGRARTGALGPCFAFGLGVLASLPVVAEPTRDIRPVPRPEQMRPQPRPDKLQAAHGLIRRPVERPPVEVRESLPETVPLALLRPTPRPDRVPEPRPALPAGPVDVVMIGDSLTAGGNWAARFPSLKVANAGVDSDTALKVLARLDAILATKPDRAFIMIGINDVYNGVPVDRIAARYARIVQALQARDVAVTIQSTVECDGAVCGSRLARVRVLNARLEALARERGAGFLDLNATLSGPDGLRPEFSRDGVHINAAGYRAWYAILARAL